MCIWSLLKVTVKLHTKRLHKFCLKSFYYAYRMYIQHFQLVQLVRLVIIKDLTMYGCDRYYNVRYLHYIVVIGIVYTLLKAAISTD